MKTTKSTLLNLGFVGMLFAIFPATSAHAIPYDFTYRYADPHLAASQTYIVETNNVVLYNEYPVWLWKPTVGAATEGASPGYLVYHFDFGSDVISEAHLRLNMPTFHWSYSQGHNSLEASTDGSSWSQLMDVPPPVYGSANGGFYNQDLPSWFMGASDIWLKINLDSYGPVASSGGILTNTAQHSRWDVNSGLNVDTFKLEVAFKQDQNGGGETEIPEPATLLLLGAGMCGLRFKRHSAAG